MATYKVKLVGLDGDHENEFDAPYDWYILDAAESARVELPYYVKSMLFEAQGSDNKAGNHYSEACLNEGTCFPLGGYSIEYDYMCKVTSIKVVGGFNGDLESGLDLKQVSGHHN
nr:ferredoxin, root R-B1-like [Tanacetum cinerariifolium]